MSFIVVSNGGPYDTNLGSVSCTKSDDYVGIGSSLHIFHNLMYH